MGLNPKVWGPHYWFFLHTVAMTYPHHPNSVTKKKYYDFLQNLPLFIPIETMATDFSKLLDEYPLTPYLDNRESLIRWMHFIHNKINEKLELPKITLQEFYIQYYEHYKPIEAKNAAFYKIRAQIMYAVLLLLLFFLIYYLFNK